MKILGIHDGHNASAALVVDGELKYAASEERYSRLKHHYGFPKTAINKILSRSKYQFDYIDLGGGMGINYNKDNKKLNYLKLSKSIYNFSKKNNCKIIFEPGRSIVCDTAVLLTKVIYVKNNLNSENIP